MFEAPFDLQFLDFIVNFACAVGAKIYNTFLLSEYSKNCHNVPKYVILSFETFLATICFHSANNHNYNNKSSICTFTIHGYLCF